MSIDFQTTTIPGYDSPDEIPDFDGITMCSTCHAAPVKKYGGRGPRPTKCDGCSQTKTSGGSPKVKGKNAALAAQATAALMQLNNFVALGIMLMQLQDTARKFREEVSRESFEDTVFNALILDPELCAWICRGGVKSGKIALLIGYGMVGAAVAPVAIAEVRRKKREREEAEEEAEREERRNLQAQPVWETR